MQRLPNCAMTHVNACGQHMTILRRFGPPLQWNVVVVDGGVRRRYVVQPWYQFIADNDFSHGAERNEDKGYVGVHELNLKVGNWGWCVSVWFVEVGELVCAITRSPPSTT